MSNLNQQSSSAYEEYLERRQLKAVPINVALEAAKTLLKSSSPVKPFIMGGAGVGKTMGISEIAKEEGWYLCLIMGGFATAEQERGVPVINENEDGSISFSPAARDLLAEPLAELRSTGKIVRGEKEYTEMLILFDELNQADSEVLKIFFSAFSSNTLPGLDWNGLPVHVAATGNPPVNGYQVKKIHLSEAWDRRLCTIAVEDSTFSAWARWAKPAGVCGEVISFLKADQALLHPGRSKEEKVPTPATWAAVSGLIKSGLNWESRSTGALLEGMLGHMTGHKFRQHLLNGAVDALTGEELLDLPWSEVEEHLKGLVKDGRLAQLAYTIRSLGEYLCSNRPPVEDLSNRIPQILFCVPRDTAGVYSSTIVEYLRELPGPKEKELVSYLSLLNDAIMKGALSREWVEHTRVAANLKLR